MSLFKKTLFWVIVLIGLAGGFFLFDQRQETVKEAREAELKLLPIAVKDIQEFWISRPAEKFELRAQRSPEGWQLTQPLNAPGDAKAIEKLLHNVVTARKDAILFTTADPAKLAELGFGERDVEMGIKTAGAETVMVLGEKGPTHNIAYLMFKGRPEVFRVHSDLKKETGKDAYALRDKTILDFDPVKMRRVEIAKRGEPRVVVEQDRARWNLVEPTPGRASMAKTLELLYAVRNSEIKAFVNEQASDLAPYGLANPLLQISVLQEGQTMPHILTIGDKDRAQRAYFARTNRVKKIIDVEEELVNTLLLGMNRLGEDEKAAPK